MNTQKRSLLSATLVAALAAAGCSGGGGDNQTYMPPPPPAAKAFTDWSKQAVFTQAEDTVPIVVDTLVFNFDGDDNPNAYTDLLPVTP